MLIEEYAYRTLNVYVTVGKNVRIRNVNLAHNYHTLLRSEVITARYKPNVLFNCYNFVTAVKSRNHVQCEPLQYKIFPSIRQSQINVRCKTPTCFSHNFTTECHIKLLPSASVYQHNEPTEDIISNFLLISY